MQAPLHRQLGAGGVLQRAHSLSLRLSRSSWLSPTHTLALARRSLFFSSHICTTGKGS